MVNIINPWTHLSASTVIKSGLISSYLQPITPFWSIFHVTCHFIHKYYSIGLIKQNHYHIKKIIIFKYNEIFHHFSMSQCLKNDHICEKIKNLNSDLIIKAIKNWLLFCLRWVRYYGWVFGVMYLFFLFLMIFSEFSQGHTGILFFFKSIYF